MRKIAKSIWALSFIVLLTGCTNFAWKKPVVTPLPLPFPPKTQDFTVYEITMPSDIFEQEQFYQECLQLLEKSKKEKKRYIIVVNSQLYLNIKRFLNGNLTTSELVFEKPASLLTNEEQEYIEKLYPQFFTEKTITEENYIKAQCYFFLTVLDETPLYDSTLYYTEYDKQQFVSRLESRRKEQVLKSGDSGITLIESKSLGVESSGTSTILRDDSVTSPLSQILLPKLDENDPFFSTISGDSLLSSGASMVVNQKEEVNASGGSAVSKNENSSGSSLNSYEQKIVTYFTTDFDSNSQKNKVQIKQINIPGVQQFGVEDDDVVLMYEGSGASLVVTDSIKAQKPLIPIPLTILENTNYHGYVYANKQFTFFVGGKEPYYQYKGYNLDINIVQTTPAEILSLPSSSNILKELQIQ